MKFLPCITANLLLEYEYPLMVFASQASSLRWALIDSFHEKILEKYPEFPYNVPQIIRVLEQTGDIREFYCRMKIINKIHKLEMPFPHNP